MNDISQATVAVHSIDHFAIIVHDLDQAGKFYSEFGLDVIDAGNYLTIRAFCDSHIWGYVYKGARKRLHHLSFSCYEQDFQLLQAQVSAAGGEPVPAPSVADAAGFWFRDRDGNVAQIKVGPKVMPDQKSTAAAVPVGAGERGFVVQAGDGGGRPRRLAHALLFTPDVRAAVSFYQQALGLRVADRGGDVIAFTYAPHGCDHHLLAFALSSAPGLHHVAWDMSSVNDVGLAAERMKRLGHDQGWGLGRHVQGSNYFYYVRDPWGGFCEYTCDIDYIPAGAPWRGEQVDVGGLFGWGPEMPDYFLFNSEA